MKKSFMLPLALSVTVGLGSPDALQLSFGGRLEDRSVKSEKQFVNLPKVSEENRYGLVYSGKLYDVVNSLCNVTDEGTSLNRMTSEIYSVGCQGNSLTIAKSALKNLVNIISSVFRSNRSNDVITGYLLLYVDVLIASFNSPWDHFSNYDNIEDQKQIFIFISFCKEKLKDLLSQLKN